MGWKIIIDSNECPYSVIYTRENAPDVMHISCVDVDSCDNMCHFQSCPRVLEENNREVPIGNWKCVCGAVNANYVSHCPKCQLPKTKGE